MLSHFDSKMDHIQTSLNTIHGSLSTLGDQISELEQRVGSNEDNISDLEKRVKTLEKENSYLKDKVEDAENRSRSSNLRFLHIPERAEGRDILGFMNQLIPRLLGKDNFPTPPNIERVHRSPTARRQDFGAGPRPILVKFLNFQDKLKILRLAQVKKELTFNGVRVHIYPDFSAGLLQRRRQFDPIKKKLRDLDIKYSLLYPATLRVIIDGKPSLFASPDDADAFLRDIPMNSP